MESRIGVVYIINKFKVKNRTQPFRCILIYQDKMSEFCFVKPLLYKMDLEIAMELFRIFTSYGPPKSVHVNSCNSMMVANIDRHIEILCPMFHIEFLKINDTKTTVPMLVVTKLHEWMELTSKDQWEIGCCVVQRIINTKVAVGKDASPHDLFFNNRGTDKETDLSGESDSDMNQICDEECENEPMLPIGSVSSSSDISAVAIKKEVIDMNVLTSEVMNYETGNEGTGVDTHKSGRTDNVQIKTEIDFE